MRKARVLLASHYPLTGEPLEILAANGKAGIRGDRAWLHRGYTETLPETALPNAADFLG
jgi:hypothetical protein